MRVKRNKRSFSIARELKSLAPWLAAAALLAGASVAAGLFAPTIMGRAIDVLNAFALGSGLDFDRLKNLLLALVCVFAVSAVCDSLKTVLMNYAVARHFTCSIRTGMSGKFCSLPVSYFDRCKKGEVISRMMNDVSVLGNTVHSFMDLLIVGVIQIAAITVMMYLIDPYLATAVVATLPVSVAVSVLLSHRSEKLFAALQKSNGEMYAMAEEYYGGIKTIRAFGGEAAAEERFAAANRRIRDNGRKAYFCGDVVQPVVSFVDKLAYCVVCLIGGFIVVGGRLTIGAVVAIILYAKQIANPVESIAFGFSQLYKSRASSRRIDKIMSEPEMPPQPPERPLDGGAEIAFEHVSFSYDPEKPLIEDLNLLVWPGEKVANVGPTGGGKTTIVNLLMRFYDIGEGCIRIGGRDIRETTREALRQEVSMVLQDTWLFTGTIAENVAYGREGATREEVEAACRAAYCDDFIRSLPKGYDTLVSEDAANLSGGQKQLLTIARALLSDKKILVLDEATSNVDTKTELSIQRAMDRLMRGRTSFVIAHRLSTIVNADNILVVRHGKVVEQGRHDALMAKNGFYTELYNSQYKINL